MTPKKRNILIASSVAAVLLGVGSYSYYKHAMNNFGFEISGAKLNSISNGVANVTLTFNVWSKLGISFDIKLIQLNLYANGIFVGTVQQEEKVTVPTEGSTSLDTTVLIDLTVAQNTALSLISSYLSGDAKLDLLMEGYCKFRIKLPILSNFDLKYNVKELTNII